MFYRFLKKFPIPRIPYKWQPHQLWYRFRCFVWDRYTTVKPRKLSHQWYDRSGLLPMVMFEILADFVEGEKALDCHVDWGLDKGVDYVDEHGYSHHSIVVNGVKKLVGQEIKDIYDWWVKNDYTLPDEGERPYKEYHDFSRRHRTGDLFDWEHEAWDSPENKKEATRLLRKGADEEQRLNDETKEMMHRLINISSYLWT